MSLWVPAVVHEDRERILASVAPVQRECRVAVDDAQAGDSGRCNMAQEMCFRAAGHLSCEIFKMRHEAEMGVAKGGGEHQSDRIP